MKKLLFIAAAAAGMVAVADVESANTVGYTQVTIRPGLNLIGTSFLKVDTNGRPDLNSTFSDCKEKCKSGEAADEADFIQIFNSKSQGYANQEFFFYKWSEGEYEDWDYKWFDEGKGEPTAFVIPSGNAFWYKSRGNEIFSLTSSGAVGDQDVEITIKPGLNLIVNPFPCDLKLNSDSVNWKEAGVKSGEAADVADFIQIFNSKSQGYANQEFFFYKWSEGEYEDWDYKWFDEGKGEPTEFSIPAGGGFWYKSRGDKDITLTFKCPLKK